MFRILVADDDLEFRNSVQKGLELEGHTVISADNGHVANELLTKDPTIDALLTDMKMPHMDGLELIKAVRARWA